MLRRERFGWPEEQIRQGLSQIDRFSDLVDLQQRIDVIKDDPADNRILECADASGSDYLISGDNHLLALVQYSGIGIVKPTELFAISGQRERAR